MAQNVAVDFQHSMTVGDVAAMVLAAILAVLTVWWSRRTVSDEVVIGWQLRSKPEKEDGRRAESVRRWSETITDPYTLRLVAMNVGRRDIEIDLQFPALNEAGTRLFSVELVGPARTVFTSVRADLQRLDGGGGESQNRWDMVPFHLSVGQALVSGGFHERASAVGAVPQPAAREVCPADRVDTTCTSGSASSAVRRGCRVRGLATVERGAVLWLDCRCSGRCCARDDRVGLLPRRPDRPGRKVVVSRLVDGAVDGATGDPPPP